MVLITNGGQLPSNHSPTNHCSCERRSYRDGVPCLDSFLGGVSAPFGALGACVGTSGCEGIISGSHFDSAFHCICLTDIKGRDLGAPLQKAIPLDITVSCTGVYPLWLCCSASSCVLGEERGTSVQLFSDPDSAIGVASMLSGSRLEISSKSRKNNEEGLNPEGHSQQRARAEGHSQQRARAEGHSQQRARAEGHNPPRARAEGHSQQRARAEGHSQQRARAEGHNPPRARARGPQPTESEVQGPRATAD
ncbi:unnamed protein product [Boreogadus saida]